MSNNPPDLEYLSQLEELGGEIISDRREIVALDGRRNQNREAIRALITSGQPQKKTWITIGAMIVKRTQKQAQEILEKDQKVLDVEINKLRSELKLKVNRLQDLEHKPPINGLMLTPLARAELSAMHKVLGIESS